MNRFPGCWCRRAIRAVVSIVLTCVAAAVVVGAVQAAPAQANDSGSVTLSGTVTAAGVPLEGAVVWAYNPDTGKWTASAPSAADGSYAVTVAPGDHNVYVNPDEPGYPGRWLGGSSQATATVFDLTADTTQDIVLSVVLSGTVTAAGSPLEGAVGS